MLHIIPGVGKDIDKISALMMLRVHRQREADSATLRDKDTIKGIHSKTASSYCYNRDVVLVPLAAITKIPQAG